MANYVINVTQDMAGQLERHILKAPLVRNNVNAHVFNVTVVNGDDEVAMSGISANFVRSNGTTVPLDSTYCSASGNVATVTLPQTCYAIPGKAILTINCTIDSATTCIAWFDCTVLNSITDDLVDSGTVISSIEDLIQDISDAVESIPADYSTLLASIADTYSTTSTYDVGDYVWYSGTLYKCTTAITAAESWTSDNWTEAVLANDLTSLSETVSSLIAVTYDSDGNVTVTVGGV